MLVPLSFLLLAVCIRWVQRGREPGTGRVSTIGTICDAGERRHTLCFPMTNSIVKNALKLKRKLLPIEVGAIHTLHSLKKAGRQYARYAPLQLTGPLAIHHATTHLPSIAYGAVRGRGIVYPGTNYIGPGNPLSSGRPKSYHDNLARTHDYQYQYLMDKGVDPYFSWNQADREMVKKADPTTLEGAAVLMGINPKRIFRRDRTKVPVIAPYKANGSAVVQNPATRPTGHHFRPRHRTASTPKRAASYAAKTDKRGKMFY